MTQPRGMSSPRLWRWSARDHERDGLARFGWHCRRKGQRRQPFGVVGLNPGPLLLGGDHGAEAGDPAIPARAVDVAPVGQRNRTRPGLVGQT